MKEVKLSNVSDIILEEIARGAFLTVKKDDKINTMTIGWANLGRIWGLPIFEVMVRYSRYTHELIKDADSFTVSFALGDNLKDALALCGTKSGRDINKFEQCNLTPKYDDIVTSPYIAEADLHILCDILYKQPMNPRLVSRKLKERWYSDEDFHIMYYGHVKKVLLNER